MKTSIIPCPFCNKNPDIQLQFNVNQPPYACFHKCGDFYLELNSYFKTEDAAIKVWNGIMENFIDNSKE